MQQCKQQLKVVLLAVLVICTTVLQAVAEDMPNSGFLGDDAVYNKLEKVDIEGKSFAMRWIGPKLTPANYTAVLVENVVLYPAPEPTEQVSAETLEQISQYLTKSLREKVGSRVTTTDAAGPGVLTMQAAVTGVLVKTEGMKAYEVLPVAAIFGAAKAATGTRNRDVKVFIEVKLVDSQSGELIGAILREAEGEDLKGKKDQLTLDDMRDSLDGMSDDGSAHLGDALGS